mmetsp:Transcript_4042/g.9647  ORF Transcript_4042/g.9647 Transcript_4042/m.9647 type:complete len:317 (-) Transcript_4042:4892-5842(-)
MRLEILVAGQLQHLGIPASAAILCSHPPALWLLHDVGGWRLLPALRPSRLPGPWVASLEHHNGAQSQAALPRWGGSRMARSHKPAGMPPRGPHLEVPRSLRPPQGQHWKPAQRQPVPARRGRRGEDPRRTAEMRPLAARCQMGGSLPEGCSSDRSQGLRRQKGFRGGPSQETQPAAAGTMGPPCSLPPAPRQGQEGRSVLVDSQQGRTRLSSSAAQPPPRLAPALDPRQLLDSFLPGCLSRRPIPCEGWCQQTSRQLPGPHQGPGVAWLWLRQASLCHDQQRSSEQAHHGQRTQEPPLCELCSSRLSVLPHLRPCS